MCVKLNEEDMGHVKEIYQAITKTLSNMPLEFMSSNKFGSWTVNALINLLCSLYRIMALNKDDLLKAVEDVWDKYEELYKKILDLIENNTDQDKLKINIEPLKIITETELTTWQKFKQFFRNKE